MPLPLTPILIAGATAAVGWFFQENSAKNARKRQNARYDSERAVCISRAEKAKQECDRLNAQALRSCQIESGFEESACESAKSSLKAFNQEKPLADVSTLKAKTGRA